MQNVDAYILSFNILTMSVPDSEGYLKKRVDQIQIGNLYFYCSQCLIKTYISNLVHTTRFCNNHHQVRSKSKYCKAK